MGEKNKQAEWKNYGNLLAEELRSIKEGSD